MIKSVVILSCILAISQLGNISYASNQPDWSTGNENRVSIPNEKTIFNDQEKDGTNRTKRNVVLLIPVSTSEEADNSEEGELSEEVDELIHHGHKTKRCKAPNPLRKARRIPVMKNLQQHFSVSTETSVDNSAENLGDGRSYFRLASMKDAKNILKSILKSRSTKREDNDAIVETVSNPQDESSISLLTKSAKRSGQRGKKYVCYCIEDNCGSKKAKNPSRPYAMKRPIGPNVLSKSFSSENEENLRKSGSPFNDRQTLGAPNNLQCPPGAVLVEESDNSERLGRKHNPKRRPVKKCPSIIPPCDSETPSIGQPTRINIPLSGNRKLNRRVYKVDRKLPFAQKLQSVIEQNEAHDKIPCPDAETSNNNNNVIDLQDYYNDQQSNLNQYAQIPLGPNLVYPNPYAVYPRYPQFPQYPQYDDGLVGEPQIPLQLVNPPCEEYQQLPYEATPLGRNFIDINECIKMFGRNFCIVTTTTITSVPESAVNYGDEDEEPAIGSHWDEEIEQSNTEPSRGKTTWVYPAKVYNTDNVAVTHFQEPESSDHVDDDGEDHLHDSDPYPPSRIAVTSGPYRVGTTHHFSSQSENGSPVTVPSLNQEKSADFDEHENPNPNSPLRYNDPDKLEYLIPDSDESIESEAQDMYELGDEAKENVAPNSLSSERITEFPQLGSTISSSSWQGAHRISSPQYLEYTVKPTENNIPQSSNEDISEEITERIPTYDSKLPDYETSQYRYSTQSSYQQQGRNGNAVVYYTRRPNERVGITKQHTMDGSVENDSEEEQGSSSPNTVYAKMEEPSVNFRTTVQPQHSKGNELQSSEEITTYRVIDNEDRSVSTSSRAQSNADSYSTSPSSNLYYSIQPEISTGDYASTNAKIMSSSRQHEIVELTPINDYPKSGATSGNNGYASSNAAIKNTGIYTTPYYAEDKKTTSAWAQEVGERNTEYDFKGSPSIPDHTSDVNEYSTTERNFYPHFVGSHQSSNDEQTTEKSDEQFFGSDAPMTENYLSTLKSSDSVGNTADASKNKDTSYIQNSGLENRENNSEEYPFDTKQPEDVTNNYDGVTLRDWYYTTLSGRKTTGSSDRQTTADRSSQGQYVGTYHSIPSEITSTSVQSDLSEKPAFYSDKINLSTTKGHDDDSQRPMKTSPENNFYLTPSDRPSFMSTYRTTLEPEDLKSMHSTGDDYSNEDTTNNYTKSQSILGTTSAEDVGKSEIQHEEVSRYSDQERLASITTPGEYEHYNEGKSPLSDSEKMYTPIVATDRVGDYKKTTEMAPKYTFYYTTQPEDLFATDSHRVSTEPANLELAHSTSDYDYSNEDTTNSYITSQSILGETMAAETKPSQKSHPLISTPSEYEHYNEGKSPLSDSGKMHTPIITTSLVGDHQKTTESAPKYTFYTTQSEESFDTNSHRASTEPANLELAHSTEDDDYSNEDTTNSYITSQSILGETMAAKTKPSQKSHPFISTPSEYEHYNEGKTPFSDSGKMYTPIVTTGLVGDHHKTTEMAPKYTFDTTQSEEPLATDSHRASTEPANLELAHSTGDYDYSNEDTTNSYITSQSILGETMAAETEPSQKSHPFISTPSEYEHHNEGKSPLRDSGKMYTPIVATGRVGGHQKTTEMAPKYTFYYTTQPEDLFATDSHRLSTESANLELAHSSSDYDYSNEDTTNSYMTSQSILGETMASETKPSQKSHPFISTPSEYEHYNEGKSPLSVSEKMYTPTVTTGLVGDHQKITEMAPKYTFYTTQSEEPFFTNSHRASTEPANLELAHSTRDYDYSNEDTTNSYITSQSILGETMAAETKPSQKSHPLISTPSEYEYHNEGKTPLSVSGKVHTPTVTTGLVGDHQKITEMAPKYTFYTTQSEEPFVTDSHRASTEPVNLELAHSTEDYDYSNEDTTNSYKTSQSILGETMAAETEPSQKSHPFISTPSEYEHYNEGTSPLSDSGKLYTPIVTTGLVGDHQKITEMAPKYTFYSTQSEEPFATDSLRASTEPANLELAHSTGDNDYSNEDTTNSYITSQSILGETMAAETKPSQKSHPFISTPSEYEHYNEGKTPLSDSGKMYTPIVTTGLVGDHRKTTEMAPKYTFDTTQSEEPLATDSHRASTEPSNLELAHSTEDYDYSNEDTTNSYITAQSILGETMAAETEPSQKSHPFISTPSEYVHHNEGKSPLSVSGKLYTPIVTTGLVGDHQKITEMAPKYTFYTTQSEEPFVTDSHRASTEPANLELAHSTEDYDYSNEDTTNSYMTSQSILGETKAIGTESSQKYHPFITTSRQNNYYEATHPQGHSLQPSDLTSNSYDGKVGDLIRPNFNNEEGRVKTVNDFTTMSSDDLRVNDRNDEINYSTILKHADEVTRPETFDVSNSDYSEEYTTTHDFVGKDLSQTEITRDDNDYHDYSTIKPVTQIIDDRTRPYQAKNYEGTHLTTSHYETISPQSRKESTKVSDEEVIGQSYKTELSHGDITSQRTILDNTQPKWNTLKISKSTEISEIPREEEIKNQLGASHSMTQSSVTRHFENPSRVPHILKSENMVRDEMTTEVERNYDSTTNQYSQSILKSSVKNPIDEYSEDDGNNYFSSIDQDKSTSPQPVVGNNLPQMDTSESDSSVYDTHNLATISNKLSTITNERPQLTTHEFVGDTLTDEGSSTIKNNDGAFTNNALSSTPEKNSPVSRTEPTFSNYNKNVNLEDASLSNNDRISTSQDFSTETSTSEEFSPSYDLLRKALKAMTATDVNTEATRLMTEKLAQQDDTSKSITSTKEFTPFFDKVGDSRDAVTTPKEYFTHPYQSISSATPIGNTFGSQSFPDSQDVTSSTVEYEESRRPYDATLKNEESVGTELKTHSVTTTMPTDTLRPVSTAESINNSEERYALSSSPSGIVLQPHYDDYQTATIDSSTNGEYSPYTQIASATVDNTLRSQSSPESQDITSSIAKYDSTGSEHDLMPKNEKSVESTLQMHSITPTYPTDILRSMLTDEPASNSHEEYDATSSTNKLLLQPYYTDYQTISTQNPQINYSPYKSILTGTGNTLASQSLPNSEEVTSYSVEDSPSSEHPSILENKESVGTALHTLSITSDPTKISSPISMLESDQTIPTNESPTQTPGTESSLHKISSPATLVGNTLGSQSFVDSEDVTSSSMGYEGSISLEHDLTPMNQKSVGGLHTYSETTTQSNDKFTTNVAQETVHNGVTSSTIGIELPSPYTGYHIIPKSDNTEEVVGNNHISDKDQNFLRTAVQKVVNDLISPKSNDAYKDGAEAETVGSPSQGLLTKLPVLKNLFSLPEVKDLAISTVKGLITGASGVPQDSSLGRLGDHVIESVLNNVVNELIPGETTPSSSMDVDEHRFENGRWTVVPATLAPNSDNVGLQPDDKVSSSIKDILGRSGIGLQGAKLPIVQNIIVRAVENGLKKAKNVVSHSVIWDTLNKIIARAENFDKSPHLPVLTTKSLPKPPGIKTPSAPMKNLPVIPITEHVFKNGQWSEKHTVLGNTRKDFQPKLSTISPMTSRDNNELLTSPLSYQSSIAEANEPDYTTKPVDYALLGESDENSDETTLKHVIGMTDSPNEQTVGAASRNQNIDDNEDLEKSPIKYFSPHDRILTYIKNHQTPGGKMPTTLSSLDTQHTTGYNRPWTVMESNEAGMDDESGKFQHLPASNNDKVPTGLTEEPRLGSTEKKKTCKCMDEEEKHIDNKVGLSRQNSSKELKTITPVVGEENYLYSPSTIHHLDVEDGEDTDYTTEEFIGENNPQMSPNSIKDAEMKISSTESQEFSTIHHLDVIQDNGYSTEEYISNENQSTEETTAGISEEVGNTQLSSPQSTVNYLYEDEESEEDATREYTDDNTSTTDSAEKLTENQSPSQSTDSTAYFDIGTQSTKVGNTRNFDQGEDRQGITHGDESTTKTLDKKIPKLIKYPDTTSEATTASRGLVGAAKRPEKTELFQENLKDSPSFVTPKWDPTYFGKISPSNGANLNGDKISDLVNTELFYVGDGVKIPLTIRRMPDGSYALSISEKICENFVNRECPCCVPKEGDIVEEKRQLNDPEDAEDETASSKNSYGTLSSESTESSEYENKSKKRYVRSTSGSDVIVTSASPVSSFIQKYNLTLNLEDNHDPIASSITNRKTVDQIRNKNKTKFSRSSNGAKILNLFKNDNMLQRDDSEEVRPIMDDNSETISKESNTIRKSEFTYDSDTNSFISSLVNIRDVPENKRAEVILNALDGLINSDQAKNLDSTEDQNTMKIIDDHLANDKDSSDLDLDEVENEMARYGYQKDNPILERIRYIKKYQQGHGQYKYQQNIDHHARGKMNVLKTVLHWLKEVFLESKVNSKK